ncbi:MAG: protein kinase [Verrucomicrobia bacterium]|nr:protein kinase [Verrucomicrobiota bacterium]
MNDDHSTQWVPIPPIPDHQLIRKIGKGGFGEVWLARVNATGRFRAVKIVHRRGFQNDLPYEMEFSGLNKFDEVSREHVGFVDILHICRNDHAKYFACVMELADDLETGSQIDPAYYEPKTLDSELRKRKRLTPAECIKCGLALAEALAELHRRSLVHRDIKPSNIVFVRGAPKLADVGLVTEIQATATLAPGTEHYMDFDTHGTARGDLYALGKVLYVMATGCGPDQWPDIPMDVQTMDGFEEFQELERIFYKACHPNLSQRYASAEEIQAELLLLRAGHSSRRLAKLEAWAADLKRYGVIGLILALLAGFTAYQATQHQKQQAELRQRKIGSFVAYGTRAMDENDLPGSLPWFAKALEEDHPRNEQTHRLRFGAVLQQSPRIVQMWFNEREISPAAFANQENQVLTPLENGQWGICDLATGKPLARFGTGSTTESASLTSDSRLAVTSDYHTNNQTVRLWDVKSGRERSSLAHEADVCGAVISSDGQWVAACAETNVVLWNVPTGGRRVLTGHTAKIVHVAFSHSGRYLVSSGLDTNAILWEVTDARLMRAFTNHQSGVFGAAFSPDETQVASASFDRSTRVWERDTGRELLPPLWHGDGIQTVEFSPDGLRLVTAGLDFAVRVWDARTGQLLHLLRHNAKPVHAAFSPQGRHIVTGCYDGVVRVWDLQPRLTTPVPQFVSYSRGGSRFLRRTIQGIGVYDTTTNLISSITSTGPQSHDARFNDDGKKLFTLSKPIVADGTTNCLAVLWDSATATTSGSAVALPMSFSNDVILSPNGRYVAAFAKEDTGGVWEFESGLQLLRFTKGCRQIAFDPSDERVAVVIGNDLQIWSLTTKRALLPSPCAHPASTPVVSLAWSPNGIFVITACSNDGFDSAAAYVWNANTGQREGAPLDHRDGVLFAAFSPNSESVITCSEDFTAVLWDAKTGRPQPTPPLRHKNQVVHAAFSSNGLWVATVCRDWSVRIWDTKTGEPLTPPFPHPAAVRSVQWVDAGRLLVTQAGSNQTWLWKLPEEHWQVKDMKLTAQLLSGQLLLEGPSRSTTTAMMPQSKDALRQVWHDIRTNHLSDFSFRAMPDP